MDDEPLIDLDREIARLLDVGPSPGFAARVRQRVVREQADAQPIGWTVGAAAAVAVVACVAVAFYGGRTEPVRSSPPAIVGRQVASPAGTLASDGGRTLRQRPAAPQGRRRAASAPLTREPQVLIDEAEARAIRAVLDGIYTGRVTVPPLPVVGEIGIAPIEVTPMASDERKEPERP